MMRRWLLNNSSPGEKNPERRVGLTSRSLNGRKGKFDMAAAVANNLVEVEPENSSW